jgi:hypothetical protein
MRFRTSVYLVLAVGLLTISVQPVVLRCKPTSKFQLTSVCSFPVQQTVLEKWSS